VAAANDAYERVRKTAEVGDLRLGAPLAVLSDVTIQGASCDQVPSDVAAALDAVGPNIGVNDDARHIATALAYVKVTYAAF